MCSIKADEPTKGMTLLKVKNFKVDDEFIYSEKCDEFNQDD